MSDERHFMKVSGYDSLGRHFYVCSCGHANYVELASPTDGPDVHLLAIEMNHADFREHVGEEDT